MRTRTTAIRVSILAALAAAPALPADAQDPAPDDKGKWENLGSATLSPSGDWLAYAVSRNDETSELRIRRVDDDSARVVEWGERAVFAPDGAWLVYAIGVSADQRERLQEAGDPVELQAELLNLATGETRTFGGVRASGFDAEAGYLALHGYAPEEPEGKGADIRVVELATGRVTTFGNVGEYAWSDTGSMLAMAIATGADDANGVQVFDAATGRIQSLDASASAYGQLAWREDALDLAAMRSVDPASDDGDAQEVLAWRGLGGAGAAPEAAVLSPGAMGLADSLDIVTAARPQWSDDGTMISIGLRPGEPDDDEEAAEETETEADEPAEGEDEEGETEEEDEDEADAPEEDDEPELPGVQIWHSSDVRVFPQQQAQASFDERRSLLAVWHLGDGRVVQIGSKLLAGARLLEGWERALEDDDEPYPWGAMFGRRYHDVWVVDVDTGDRKLLIEEVRYEWASDGGRYVVSYDGANYASHDLETGAAHDLTSGLAASFADSVYDTPTDVTPPWGFGPGGWLEGDAGVLLYDRYDIWRVGLDGSGGVRLTDGTADRIEHRVAFMPDDETPGLDPDEPIYLSLYGDWSERRGYARLQPNGTVDRLVLGDAYIYSLAKADSADVYAYRRMAFDDPPDLFVGGPRLANARQVTEINPFFAEEPWGRSELVEYTSERGVPLQAVLYYPADHVTGTPVPTIVYTYEMRSPSIHIYSNPNDRSYYNFTDWTRAGYAVLQPDIVYTAREPGPSAIASVRAAVARVVEMGVTDPDAVGLIGHSWGGYQAAYLPTRTDIFAASVAGAPLTDFVSMMGAIHWNPGVPEVDHWETGQARMEVPFWEDEDAHRESSPIHGIPDLETPMLMAFGDDDGVVDWDQGTEFYNFARRAGKQMVLLVYEGEDHGFQEEANQIDYHRRILEWFGHYLKGEPAPAWITDGVALGDLEDEKKRVAKKGGH